LAYVRRVPEPVLVDSGRSGVSHAVRGVTVGAAEYPDAPTGCTVIRFGGLCRLEVDRRGGSVGVVGDSFGVAHALCLAGGSLLGLEATAGVASGLFEEAGRRTGFGDIPIVAGAIIYDFGPRTSSDYPDVRLGRAAFAGARPSWVPVGRSGAGVSATVGKGGAGRPEPGGQGASSGRFGDHEILVVTVVNAVGVVCDRSGAIVAGNRHADGVRHHLADDRVAPGDDVQGNTTLTAVIVDARMGERALRQLARQVHASMARAIQPFHTPRDGDVLFAAATARGAAVPSPESLAEYVSERAWDAVLVAVDGNSDSGVTRGG
jgi:6-aminohexanoate-oligomer endohydrolase